MASPATDSQHIPFPSDGPDLSPSPINNTLPSTSSPSLSSFEMELNLESPLEALVFRYSATIAGYIWTCLALFAAGIGLWRFRLLGSASRSSSAPALNESLFAAVSPAISPPPPTSAPMVVSDCGEREESGWSTKGRFTAYFLVEEEIDGGDKGDECEGVCGGGECLGLLDWGWRGDLGWYGYQDWKAINGSVVRLWDCGRRE